VKGNDYINSSDYVQAIECYDKASALDPENAAVYCNRALAYLKLKKYSKAIEDCEKALKLNPEYMKAYHRRGKARMEMSNYRDAVKDFEIVLKAEPDNKTVNSDLKKCRDELKKNGGFKRIEIVEEEEEETEESQQDEEIKVNKEPQPNVKAQETKELPTKAEPKVTKEESSSQEKFIEEDFELILEDDSLLSSVFDTVSKMKQEGNDLYQKGKYTEAIKIYHSALDQLINLSSHNPKLTNEKAALYNNITACYLQQGDHLKVIEFSSATISLKPTDKTLLVKAYLRRALANEANGVIISAKEDMVHVKELDPSNLQASKALQRYASIFAEKRQETALRSIENANNVIEKAERFKEAGNNFFKRENYDAAILDFENGINVIREYYPEKIELMNHPQAVNILVQLYNNKALANLKLECNALVIKDCEAALELEPQNLKSLYRLAKAQAACCMFEDAAKNMKKVVDREPKNAVAKKEMDEYIKKAIENKKKQAEETPRKRGGSVRFAEENKQIHFRKEDAPEEIKAALSSTSSQPKPKPKPKAVKVSTEKVATAKSMATINVADLEKPTSAFALESVANTLKKDPASFYTYLHVIFK
jgi:tetratricopeptide (TPR) repeat protein